MPTSDKSKNIKSKKRLGRGLGSLLSTDAGDFGDVPASAKPIQPKQKEILAKTQPTTAKTKVASPVPQKASQTKELDPSVRIWSCC